MKTIDYDRKADLIFKFSLWLLILVLPIIVVFLWKNVFNINAPIDHSKFGTFGDFIGGSLGAFWSLAGVLLFYIALKEQRKDIKINHKALDKQIEALNIQSKEFKLQRDELQQTRKIFSEQSKTLKKQSFESTYFSLLELYGKIVTDINKQTKSGNYFKDFRNKFIDSFSPNSVCPLECHQVAEYNYLESYNSKIDDLSHYYKILHRILHIIDEAMISEDEKQFYAKILRSQLSENEMFSLYYNSHSELSGNIYILVLRYNLFKHLPSLEKAEFKDIINEKHKTLTLSFCNSIFTRIDIFLTTLDNLIKKDGFENHKVSFTVPSLSDKCIIALSSTEQNQLTIGFSIVTDNLSETILLEQSIDQFICFFKLFLWDIFVFSTYSEQNFEKKDIAFTLSEKLLFSIVSKKKLTLNTDNDK